MNRACDSNTNVFGPVDPVGRLCVGLCGIHLIELFIIALLEIDDVTLARSADLDHGEAVGGSIGKCHQAVQEAWRRNGQANSRLLGQITCYGSSVSCRLLMPEADEPYSFSLGQPAQISDRNSWNSVDGVDSVELERVDNQMKSVG